MHQLKTEPFFDEMTNTVSYVAFDPETKKAAVIDPVLDYDAASGRTRRDSADQIIAFLSEFELRVQWILETHVHADHLSAAQYIKEKCGGLIAIGAEVTSVQKVFGGLFNLGAGFRDDGHQFDRLFADGEKFQLGNIDAEAIHTPGHTPACMTYLLGDAAFVGDTLFMPDFGTARCDFPGGDARTLYRSIQKIYALPPETRLFTCHDYKAPGRDHYAWESTVGEQMASNVHASSDTTEDAFAVWRASRDKELDLPALILPSVQINIRAGNMPSEEENGQSYLKIPLDLF